MGGAVGVFARDAGGWQGGRVNPQSLTTSLALPDIWQQVAIRALAAGRDVVVDAPTGAGKTFVFERFVELQRPSRAVFAVPTRALANDKHRAWKAQGWNVGLSTGDVTENPGAPVLVATLETRKWELLRGEGPDLLAIDEYQMLADRTRGVDYEMALACAPAHTRLLLLSGSVADPDSVAAWLRSLGREVEVVRTAERPVPLAEANLEALGVRVPEDIRGTWPRRIAAALAAGMGPVLLFAPRRAEAEALADELASQLPCTLHLPLSAEQRSLAGDRLARLLMRRIGLHHGGLSYVQRSGLVEPLAKAGQLRVVVATTGLAAGVDFSLRSVAVTDREYRDGESCRILAPDELLQMFGRAGRRGRDDKGFALTARGLPRLADAKAMPIARDNPLDWPGFLARMAVASDAGRDPAKAAADLLARLFTLRRPILAFGGASTPSVAGAEGPAGLRPQDDGTRRRLLVEFMDSAGNWERERPLKPATLGECLVWNGDAWCPALSHAPTLLGLGLGRPARLDTDAQGRRVLGLEFTAATIEGGDTHRELSLTRNLLRLTSMPAASSSPLSGRRACSLAFLERHLSALFHAHAPGARVVGFVVHNDTVCVRLDCAGIPRMARKDAHNALLLDPPRRFAPRLDPGFHELMEGRTQAQSPAHGHRAEADLAAAWRTLGLVDVRGGPTRRGRLFSFFHHGEGLAIAAALEDARYPVEDIAHDLANLRAGARFVDFETSSSRLGRRCRETYGFATHEGHLDKGLPPGYGDGAAEVLRLRRTDSAFRKRLDASRVRPGDIERVRLEWRSLLRHIVQSPDLDWDRWHALRAVATTLLERIPQASRLMELPELTPAQRSRPDPGAMAGFGGG